MPFSDWVTPTQDPINNDENVAQKSLNHRGSKGGLFLVPQDVNKTKINQRSCCNSLFGSSFMIEDLHDKLVSCWFPVSVVRSQFHYILIQNAEHLLLREKEFAVRWWIIIEVWRTQKCTLQISNIISFENDNKLWILCKNCFDLIPIYLIISSIKFFKNNILFI